MKFRSLHEEGGQKSFALVFETGDEVISGLTEFAKDKDLDAASFTAIGAFGAATLGYFNLEKKEYDKIPIHEQVEVLSLAGNITIEEDGGPQVHAHVVVGRYDGTTRGGHLLEARVRPTLEAVLTESPEHLRRKTDEETGLPLIAIEE